MRVGALESMRGLGALVVVFSHVLATFYPYTAYGEAALLQQPWEHLFRSTPLGIFIGGQFAVSLFFILSGYVLTFRHMDPKMGSGVRLAAAAVKRLPRLYPMVAVAVILPALLARLGWVGGPAIHRWLATSADPGQMGTWDTNPWVIVRVVLLNAFSQAGNWNSPLWTVRVELYGSLLAFFLTMAFRQSRWFVGILLLAIVWLRDDWIQSILIGVAIAACHHRSGSAMRGEFRTGWGVALLCAGLCLGAAPSGGAGEGIYRWLPTLPWIMGGWRMVGAVLTFCAVLGTPSLRGLLENPAGAWLGRVSFSLYALHLPVLESLGAHAYASGRDAGWGHGTAVVAAMGVTIPVVLIVAGIAARWIDRPSQQLADWVARRFQSSLGEIRVG